MTQSIEQQLSFEQAKQFLPFQFVMPSWIPRGFILQEPVRVFQPESMFDTMSKIDDSVKGLMSGWSAEDQAFTRRFEAANPLESRRSAVIEWHKTYGNGNKAVFRVVVGKIPINPDTGAMTKFREIKGDERLRSLNIHGVPAVWSIQDAIYVGGLRTHLEFHLNDVRYDFEMLGSALTRKELIQIAESCIESV